MGPRRAEPTSAWAAPVNDQKKDAREERASFGWWRSAGQRLMTTEPVAGMVLLSLSMIALERNS